MLDPNLRILIVNEMATMRKLVVDACREIGLLSIVEAPNVADAWQKIVDATPPFQIVISEWEMSQSTGIDLLKRIRRDSNLGKTPFILLTSEAAQGKILEAARAGVSAYIVKPFTPEILKEKIISALIKPIKNL